MVFCKSPLVQYLMSHASRETYAAALVYDFCICGPTVARNTSFFHAWLKDRDVVGVEPGSAFRRPTGSKLSCGLDVWN